MVLVKLRGWGVSCTQFQVVIAIGNSSIVELLHRKS